MVKAGSERLWLEPEVEGSCTAKNLFDKAGSEGLWLKPEVEGSCKGKSMFNKAGSEIVVEAGSPRVVRRRKYV